MPESLTTVAYLAAGVCFILSLGGLSSQQSAERGNRLGIAGMALAVLATAFGGVHNYAALLACTAVGGTVGAVLALRVQMTAMPELVAILHSFVGLAAALVGIATYLEPQAHTGVEVVIAGIEIFLGVFVGVITFTGSIVAYGKLRGFISGKPLIVPGRHAINLGLVLACAWLGVMFVRAPDHTGIMPLLVMVGISGFLGAHLVLAIGGADMPVVVSMLNSYSGWAAAAAGFMLSNDLLIVTGALVGSSGAILSTIMCRAMNRSIVSVILGGFGADSGKVVAGACAVAGEVSAIDMPGVLGLLERARSVVVVPGYGMAVARAQGPLREIAEILRQRGASVRFAIHPVAGRLPGHMNVLLAEARVPYDIVLEMDEINADFPSTDLVLVIGANDIVNPGALEDPGSPIYGMPVLEVWRATTSIVLKRGMAAGYAGVDNPLFYRPNNRMLFGDAKQNVDALLSGLRARESAAAQ
jgi:H+-translocating NAD(P) transhydrogenase subunit beta